MSKARFIAREESSLEGQPPRAPRRSAGPIQDASGLQAQGRLIIDCSQVLPGTAKERHGLQAVGLVMATSASWR